MVFWDILRWLLGEKKKAEEAARYMSSKEVEELMARARVLKNASQTDLAILKYLATEASKITDEELREEVVKSLKTAVGFLMKGDRVAFYKYILSAPELRKIYSKRS